MLKADKIMMEGDFSIRRKEEFLDYKVLKTKVNYTHVSKANTARIKNLPDTIFKEEEV